MQMCLPFPAHTLASNHWTNNTANSEIIVICEVPQLEKKSKVTKSGEMFSAGPMIGTKMMPVPRLEVMNLYFFSLTED